MMITFTSWELGRKIPPNYFSHGFNPCDYGAICGNQGIIEYSMARGFICTSTTLNLAARYGNLDTMRWLRDKGCPWNTDIECVNNTGYNAALGGYINILEWLAIMDFHWIIKYVYQPP
jgi:hypothetical protein